MRVDLTSSQLQDLPKHSHLFSCSESISPNKQLSSSQLPAGANVNSVKFHEMALHHAARVNMVDMIELLVEFGANVYASDNLERKPVDYTTPASPAYTCLMFYESKFKRCFRAYRRPFSFLTFAFES